MRLLIKCFLSFSICFFCQSVLADKLNAFFYELKNAECIETSKFNDNAKHVAVFECKKAYPDTPINGKVVAALKKAGWIEQNTDIPEWQTFQDLSAGTLRTVAQREYMFTRKHEVIEILLHQTKPAAELNFPLRQVVNVVTYAK